MRIKSSIRNYRVFFKENFYGSLKDVYNDGDVIILDAMVSRIYDIPEGIRCINIVASEGTKSFDYLPIVLDSILSGGFNKKNKIIAIGGGIIQDISSFISSILFRGVEWVFFPTTLLAQADSCIGGKTSINYGKYKNQLGNFNPPSEIIVCQAFLSTLSDMDIKSGLGEMLHFFMVSGNEDLDMYRSSYKSDIPKLTKRCLEIKKWFIEKDEFDKAERLLLNYGHTFGHAIENITNYKYPHGISVCMGMDIANFISLKRGYISHNQYMSLKELTSDVHGCIIEKNDIDSFIAALDRDKKNNKPGFINCVLTGGPGAMFLENIDKSAMRAYLEEYYDGLD
jgi:3-dehydroquinate synthase